MYKLKIKFKNKLNFKFFMKQYCDNGFFLGISYLDI